MNPSLNIAFVGNGDMSKAMQSIALERHHSISSIKTRDNNWQLQDCDIVVLCITPTDFMESYAYVCAAKKDIIIVTTGWYEHLPTVEKMAKEAGIRVLWSSNYSIGVNVYFRIVSAAAQLMDKVEEYDLWATEIHHKNKVDSPSGTAKTLTDILLNKMTRKTAVVEDALQRKIAAHEFHFSSTRGGVVNFGHTIGFDSAADVIELKHTARNRSGYALGAIKAMEWLNQQAEGVYTMDDFLTDLL